MIENSIHLPETVGLWTLNDSPQRVDSTNIFDYMDGAGELYLGYRFDHLESYEYQTDDSMNSILVELYFMKSSDDAFGLLSLDWGGEPVDFVDSLNCDSTSIIALAIRALYGGGLMRIWSDNLFVRIMAYRETPESREAIFALGKSIVSHRHVAPQPQLLNVLAAEFKSGWKLRQDRIGFFRSYLVLNSFYYLSHRNILDLDHSAESVTATYEKESDGSRQKIQILFVKYAADLMAENALTHFIEAYLPGHQGKVAQFSKSENFNFFKIEDGWLGYKLERNCIAIVFQCPDEQCVRDILTQIQFKN